MKSMSPTQFKKAQAELGLSEEQVSRLFLVELATVYNWRTGLWRVPGGVTLAMHMLLAHKHELNKWTSL